MDEIYKKYFDSVPSYLTIQDKDFHLLDANQKFKNDFGEIEGRYCYQVYKNRSEKCENCPVEKTFRDGQPHTSEEKIKTHNGNDVWVIVNTSPIYDDNGNIISVMEMSTDITDAKNLQDQLRTSQQKYHLLFEEVPCYISIQDKNLKIVEANRMHREAFGTSFGSMCYKVYKHRNTKCEPCIIQQTFEDGKIHSHEEVVTSQDNKRINVMVYAAPIKNGNGEVEHVIEMSTDITEIRQLQDKLSSVGLLIGSISHGIKGLLNGLDGGIYLVNTGLKKDDRKRIDQGWEIASRNIRRIRSMVMDILYYAKDREPQWEDITIKELTDEVCENFGDRAKRNNIDYICEIDPDAIKMEADRNALRSLLINLLDNSLDACRIDTKKKTHTVTLKVDQDADQIVFNVSDNGIGMDRETREKAFSLFFSSKGAGGTGLGLFIANKIAEAHGGSIKIESEEGKGSEFMVKMLKKRPD
ncbi:MAG: PAS domain-containing sensor histidine kinase [Ignavibacteriaceae bacterium]|nr:PAS domain-containing sensor histidine kinase [Ignavibacteria bacterium]NNL19786.1 PAS domain-containing sensor histidine kinase [Ignavibacteriaceae bacterium]